MRPSTSVDKKHNVLTKVKSTYNLTSRLLADSQTTLRKIFCFFLPAHILRLEGAVWLSHIAINLFATQADSRPKQTKSLQSPTHVGFFKTILAIPSKAHLCFSLGKLLFKTQISFAPSHFKIGVAKATSFAGLTPFSQAASHRRMASLFYFDDG
jgi:hypothetical protein